MLGPAPFRGVTGGSVPGSPRGVAMKTGPVRPFLPMSGELGGDFMSGMADSIRERRAREVPEREVVVKEILNAVKAAIPELIGLAIDVATIAAVPTLIALSMTVLFRTTAFEVYLAAVGATLITMLVSDAKQKLLQRLKPK